MALPLGVAMGDWGCRLKLRCAGVVGLNPHSHRTEVPAGQPTDPFAQPLATSRIWRLHSALTPTRNTPMDPSEAR